MISQGGLGPVVLLGGVTVVLLLLEHLVAVLALEGVVVLVPLLVSLAVGDGVEDDSAPVCHPPHNFRQKNSSTAIYIFYCQHTVHIVVHLSIVCVCTVYLTLQLTSQPASQSWAVWLSLYNSAVLSQQVQSTILGEKVKFRGNEDSISNISGLYR